MLAVDVQYVLNCIEPLARDDGFVLTLEPVSVPNKFTYVDRVCQHPDNGLLAEHAATLFLAAP